MPEQFRFCLLPLAMACTIAAFVAGGAWTWFGAAFFICANLVADEFGEDYLTNTANPNSGFLTALLRIAPILHAALLATALARAAPAGSVLSAILPSSGGGLFEYFGVVASHGVVSGLLGVSFAHELIHRPSASERTAGQALLALCLHPSLAIEHVHGHHVYACTLRDPGFARRGVGFWRYLPAAWMGENLAAARFEANRLARRGRPALSIGNRFLMGLLMLAMLVTGAWALAGHAGAGIVIIGGAIGLVMVSLGNFLTHYGLVREEGAPMQPRHSWNAPRLVSTSVLINAPRHAHHHAWASDPYWRLSVMENSPIYPHGYSVMSVMAMLPPVWFVVTRPLLAAWDRRFATSGELALLNGAGSRHSGLQGNGSVSVQP